MKKVYIAISYANRKFFNDEIKALKNFFIQKEITCLVFVDEYNFALNQEKKMMKTAFNELDNSDLLIAELSTKSIGVGIEIGYAYAQQIPVIYLKKKNAEYSTTAAGCTESIIAYQDATDLLKQLQKIIF